MRSVPLLVLAGSALIAALSVARADEIHLSCQGPASMRLDIDTAKLSVIVSFQSGNKDIYVNGRVHDLVLDEDTYRGHDDVIVNDDKIYFKEEDTCFRKDGSRCGGTRSTWTLDRYTGNLFDGLHNYECSPIAPGPKF